MKKIIPFLLIAFLAFSVQTQAQQGKKDVKIVELTSQSFKQKVWNFDSNKSFLRVGNLPVILDFYATWCPPCKKLSPLMQAIQNKYAGKLVIYKIDVDKEPKLASLFKIEAMPTMVFMNSKNQFTSEVGYMDFPELEKLVKQKFKL